VERIPAEKKSKQPFGAVDGKGNWILKIGFGNEREGYEAVIR
jgi:hypothetical protein